MYGVLEIGDLVVGNRCENEDWVSAGFHITLKTTIGKIKEMFEDSVSVEYDYKNSVVCYLVPKKFVSRVKIIDVHYEDKIYRVENVAGGYTYLHDSGFGEICIYDTCINSESVMLAVLADVAGQKVQSFYDKAKTKDPIRKIK